MENQDQNAMQRTSPVWAYQFLASMHFIRSIMLVSYLVISLPLLSNETNTLLLFLWIFSMFTEMLIGFLFLTRRFGIQYLALLYFVTGTLAPYSTYRSASFFLFIILNIYIYSFIPTWLFVELAIGATNLMELILLLLLGLNWIKHRRGS